MNRKPIRLLTTALVATSAGADQQSQFDGLPHQSLEAPYYGQHAGCAFADLNGDGAMDLIFAAGRHWVDQSFALINLGPEYDDDDDDMEFAGVKFSEALPIGPPGAYYQVDVSSSSKSDSSTHYSTVLLVGGTCHVEEPNSFGSCNKGENTPARVVEVRISTKDGGGCSIHDPYKPCSLEYTQMWQHPNPKGDRNGGFAIFNDQKMIALLGQGGLEVFQSMGSSTPKRSSDGQNTFIHTSYSSVFHHAPPTKTDPRSDYARYAGFAAGSLPNRGGVLAAGRRSDYDAPQTDDNGNILGINKLWYEDEEHSFQSYTLSPTVSGEPYPGNPKYSIQSTNYAFADIDGDGVNDLLEATFLYHTQRVPGYPLPQRVHFLDKDGNVKKTLVVLEDEDAGRSVTTGQIFSDSPLPDVVFASATGVVTLFANLGVDENSGKFRGLEQRHQLSVGTDECEVRDVVVTKLAQESRSGRCWVGIVCAVTCGVDNMGKNHIFYVEGDRGVCYNGKDDTLVSTERVI
eukprot:CAMPEP_0183740118 /NCGR_PEP_ID=MMETSP0737-20130205/58783_1 /TAXON_ID=385413 /ORGANISM="Thalassiosira miniscula, Strain CCMP1093" /LENGTH=514 /DNA_ID=CAMNT_0025975103 /DNA_START=82 /DNA_END=1626 /DNA_ORIENTATION=-